MSGGRLNLVLSQPIIIHRKSHSSDISPIDTTADDIDMEEDVFETPPSNLKNDPEIPD